MVVVGGIGSIWGSIIGATLLTVLPEWTAGVQGLSTTLTGLVLVVVVLFLPNGITGLKEVFNRKKTKTPSVSQTMDTHNQSHLTKSVGGES